MRIPLASGITVVVLGLVLMNSRLPDISLPPEAFAFVPAPEPPKVGGFGGNLGRNLVNLSARNLPVDWSFGPDNQKNILWSVDLGSRAALWGPAIYGGRIFIGTNNEKPRDPNAMGDKGVLMCFRERDGAFLWQAIHDKLASGRVNDWPLQGIVSCPAVEGDRLYYVSNRAEVVCASTLGDGTGKAKILWSLDMIKDLNVYPHNLASCSPLIVGDTLFVTTSNGVDEGHIGLPSPEAPSFLAIDKNTGKVKWKDNSPSINLVNARKGGNPNVNLEALKDQGLLLMHGQWSNPVYAEPNGKPQIIFPGGDGWIRAFNPRTGELIWKFDCNPKDSFYKLGADCTRNYFIATPVVWKNKLYIGVGQEPESREGVGHLWCVDITREPRNKDKDLSPGTRPGKTKDDPPQTVFDPGDAANKKSGLVWHYGGEAPPGFPRNYYFGRTMSTCAVHDGLCYAGEYDGFLHCLDANTGQHYWEHDMKADTWSSPYWADGKVYLGNDNGEMLIFQHGKTKKLLARIRMPDRSAKILAIPVAVNDVLYVISQNPCKLYAISTRPPR